MAGHVFISYSHKDGEYVDQLVGFLRDAGIEVWTDEGIDYGTQWPAVIETKIESCAAFVPVVSANSRDAPWVDREIDLAQELGKPILPLLLGGRRHLRLRNIQDDDVTDGQMPDQRFVQRLRTLTVAPVATPARAAVAENAVERGFHTGVDLIRRTLGPVGRRVLVPTDQGDREASDAAEIVDRIRSQDAGESIGLGYVRDLVTGVHRQTGDGGATAAVLGQAMLHRASRALRAGAHPVALRRGVDAAVTAVRAELARWARPLSTKDELLDVLLVASGDRGTAELVAEAIDRVGGEGVVTVEPSLSFHDELELTEGMRVDRGHLSAQFITDEQRGEGVLENAYVLLAATPITAIAPFVPIIEKVMQQGRPLLTIAYAVDGEALATLIVNMTRGTFKSLAVSAPGTGASRDAVLADLAVLTGASVVGWDRVKLETLTLNDLGQARRVITTKDSTTLVECAGEAKAIERQIREIRSAIDRAGSDAARAALQSRLARLAGGVAMIRVGGSNDAELARRTVRMERAITTAGATVARGFVPGGGATLARIAPTLATPAGAADLATGFELVREALSAPVLELARNGGHDAEAIRAKLLARPAETVFDVVASEFVEAGSGGLVDAVAMLETAVSEAAGAVTRYVMIN